MPFVARVAGSALVILGPDGSPTGGAFPLAGYAAAAAGALFWSSYSVFNRRLRHVPSEFIGGVCGLVSIAGLGAHLALEKTVVPDMMQWGAILLLGAGPVGLAFFAWDHATKHGHLPLLGALSYLAPLLSTLLLLLFGLTPMNWSIIAAATLIVLSAAIASFELRVRNIRRALMWRWPGALHAQRLPCRTLPTHRCSAFKALDPRQRQSAAPALACVSRSRPGFPGAPNQTSGHFSRKGAAARGRRSGRPWHAPLATGFHSGALLGWSGCASPP
ncbi:EamA family transporter [Cereibacter sphaeroides]|uniref:EamA family transporter n=1 Tax=Cereibacter sphaeroides TaxID=1063 RepID=UPI0000F2A321|nr:protein of unknown function DUF6, transmembrane [Cereibacter sphaeroides ATCC 17029]